jgi:hypothetical protein
MLRNDALGADWRAAVLRDAVGAALAAGDRNQADAWENELVESTAVPLTGGIP